MGQIYQCTGIAFPATFFCQSCQPGSVHWILPDDGSLDNSFCTLVRLQTSGLWECKMWANRATALSFKVIPVKPLWLCPYRINVDSMKMSDHVEFVAPHISDLSEPMVKRMLEGIPLTWSWTQHDMPSLHELMQSSMELFDSQPTCEVASSNEHYIHFRDTDGTSNHRRTGRGVRGGSWPPNSGRCMTFIRAKDNTFVWLTVSPRTEQVSIYLRYILGGVTKETFIGYSLRPSKQALR